MGRFITSDGLELAYAVDDFTDPWKPSQTLVLLHSAMGCKERFFAWMPILARRFRVARLDLRGHGSSQIPRDDKPLTIARLVDDVLEFLHHLGIDHAHFIGVAAGGYISMRLAMDHPSRVDSLSLFGATPGLKGRQASRWLEIIGDIGLRQFLANTIEDRLPADANPGLVNWFLDQAGGNDEVYTGRFIGLMNQQEWSDELHKITCPTFLVIPGLGKIGDQSRFDVMRDSIADITIETYAGMPHNVWDSLPERCANDAVRFLGGLAARQAAAASA